MLLSTGDFLIDLLFYSLLCIIAIVVYLIKFHSAELISRLWLSSILSFDLWKWIFGHNYYHILLRYFDIGRDNWIALVLWFLWIFLGLLLAVTLSYTYAVSDFSTIPISPNLAEIIFPVLISILLIFSFAAIPAGIYYSLIIFGGYSIVALERWKVYYDFQAPLERSWKLSMLIYETNLYLKNIVPTERKKMNVLFLIITTITLSIVIPFILINPISFIYQLTPFTRNNAILYLWIIVSLYILFRYVISALPRVIFFAYQSIRYRRAQYLLQQLVMIESQAEIVKNFSITRLGIGEYITLTEKLATNISHLEQFRVILMQITRSSWLENCYYSFSPVNSVIFAFQDWSASLEAEVSKALRDNLALMRAEIRDQQVRVQKLSTKSIEFAGVTKLQAKRLADLEKRLVI